MSKIDDLRKKKEQYEQCLIKLNSVLSHIKLSISTLENMISEQGDCYLVDDVSGGSNYLSYLLEKETNIKNSIMNNVIPGTKCKIADLNTLISDAAIEEGLN